MLVNLLSHIERFINDSIFYIVFKEHKRFYGGDERDRTADPLLARQVLSQLSYAPILYIYL